MKIIWKRLDERMLITYFVGRGNVEVNQCRCLVITAFTLSKKVNN